MQDMFLRSEKVIGTNAMEKLKASWVAVFGLGGVGSWAAEALVRGGIGNIAIIDNDIVDKTNINRQLVALHSTIGMKKTQVMKQRLLDINPNVKVDAYSIFYDKDTQSEVPLNKFSYIIDAIDTVTSKLLLINNAKALNVPIISSLGTGNKKDATMLEVTDIYKTSMCPLAKVMRRELRKSNITDLKVICSKEKPVKTSGRTIGSLSYVPPVAGFLLAGQVITDLISE